MRFKITIITGIFSLLISSLSIANPISQKEISPQKTEQATKKKSIFTKLSIFKKTKKKREKASALAIISVVTGALSLPLFVTGIPGAIAALIGVVTRILAIILSKNRKSKKLGRIGLTLGLTWLAVGLLGLAILSSLTLILGED